MKTREEILERISNNNDILRKNETTITVDNDNEIGTYKYTRNWMSREEAVLEVLLDIRDLLSK